MEFQDLVRRRGMVRAFQSDPVPDEVVDKLLGNAIRAPSAGNMQPWEFIIVRSEETKRRLAEAAMQQMFLANAPVVIAACRNTERNAFRYGDRGRHFYSLIDTAFATLMILLSARDQGLGACLVGAYEDEKIWRVLGLPPHIRSVGLVGVGWPAEPAARARRISLDRVVHQERFGGAAA